MELTLHRTDYLPTCTLGRLNVDDRFECFTLEDRWRPPTEPKVPGETCIPADRYEIVVTWSERFKARLPLLLDVPGFSGIRIHAGNTDKDTAGCLLVGRRRVGATIEDSGAALARLLPQIKEAVVSGKCWIEVIDHREGETP